MFHEHALNSGHAQYAYGSMQMSIGWNGLSMPTEGFSLQIPIVIINLRSEVLNRTLSHI